MLCHILLVFFAKEEGKQKKNLVRTTLEISLV